MAKSAYAFKLGQRVNVPGKTGVQGLVSCPAGSNELAPEWIASAGRFIYFLRWLSEDGEKQFGWFAEQDLIGANEPPVTDPAGAAAATAARINAARRRPAKKTKSKR